MKYKCNLVWYLKNFDPWGNKDIFKHSLLSLSFSKGYLCLWNFSNMLWINLIVSYSMLLCILHTLSNSNAHSREENHCQKTSFATWQAFPIGFMTHCSFAWKSTFCYVNYTSSSAQKRIFKSQEMLLHLMTTHVIPNTLNCFIWGILDWR